MRNRALTILICVAAPTFTAGTAQAAESGLYAGAGLGVYTLELDNTSFDDNASVAKVLAGYRFSNNLAIEGDYQKLFEVEDNIAGIDTELDADAWSVSLRPILPLGDMVELYGKVGYTWYDVEARGRVFGVPFAADDSDGALSWGGGADLNFGNVSLRGEVTRIEIDDTDLNLVSAAVVVRF